MAPGTTKVRKASVKKSSGNWRWLIAAGASGIRPSVGKAGDALLLTKDDGSAWEKSHQARPMADACKRGKIKPAA
jgi:hypothetical protein